MNVHPSRILTTCPLCQSAYGRGEIRLVGDRGTSKLFHCRCTQCGHAMLAVIMEARGWVSSIGLVTDLEATDAMRFQTAQPIQTDECVAWHQMLEEKSAELCALLSGPPAMSSP